MKFQSPSSGLASMGRCPLALCCALGTIALLSACGGGGGGGNGGSTGLACDDSIKSGFILDPSQVGGNTTVLLVKQFRKGDQLVLPNSTLPANVTPLTAAADMCLVKLVVGPGFTSEPPTADSWSQGIGFEVYLPEKAAWNNRIRTYGSGGYAGGFHTNLTKLVPVHPRAARNRRILDRPIDSHATAHSQSVRSDLSLRGRPRPNEN
jgi:hypothetical protein